MSTSNDRGIGASLPGGRQIVRSRAVRAALLKPILNMGRFFVGDSIPRLADPVAINARIKDLKTRGLPVAPAADSLLAKILLLIVMSGRPEQQALREALGLLAGLVLLVVEDDYFYIPETTEHVSNERVTELATKLASAHALEIQKLQAVVATQGLALQRTADVAALRARFSRTPEFERVFSRLEIHLGQGEGILTAQQDPARRQAHENRFREACVRSVNLLARLLQVPEGKDHKRLRKRITSRELKLIEIDALGAANVSDAAQAAEAQRLLDETTSRAGVEDDAANASAAEIAARLAQIQSTAGDEHEEEEGDGDWFFDMD
jgi:hypothetical protein